VQEVLIAQYGSTGTGDSVEQRVADAFVSNFSDPRQHTGAFVDLDQAKALITRVTGASWRRSALRGRLSVGRGQLKQALGMDPGHPLSSEPVVTGMGQGVNGVNDVEPVRAATA
jgi:hypothetical protein